MPIYEYKCEKCGECFELLRDFNSPPDAVCPSCGSTAKKIMSSGVGLVFKGSGFYKTDYKDKKTSACDKSKDSTCKTCPKSKAEA